MFASVRTCVRMSVRPCVCTWVHRVCVDERTDGRTHTYAPTHARVPVNTGTHALMNAGFYDQTFGRTNMHADIQTDRQTDKLTDCRTDGLTHTPPRTRACTHTDGNMLTRTYDALRYIRTHGRTDIRTNVRTEANTQVQTWKLEVRS